jgi:hypothetical protein
MGFLIVEAALTLSRLFVPREVLLAGYPDMLTMAMGGVAQYVGVMMICKPIDPLIARHFSEDAVIHKDARIFVRIIVKRLTKLGFYKQHWRFRERIFFHHYEIYPRMIRFKCSRLPSGITPAQILTDDVRMELSMACQREITFTWEGGLPFWIEVHRLESDIPGGDHA